VIALLALPALAAEVYVVRTGETVESIAARLGDPALAASIRANNALTGEPVPGTVLLLPPLAGTVDLPPALIHLSGEVTVQLPGGQRIGGATGLELLPGTEVCTGAGAQAVVRLASDPATGDHDDLRLLPDSCATIDGTTARSGRRSSLVRLRTGSASLRPSPEGGAVVITTPSGVTLGESGGFRVAVEPGGQRSEASERPAAVFGAGAEVDLAANQGNRTPTGQRPSAAVTLPPVGALLTPADGLPLRRAEFAWTAADRAIAWRLEIAVDPDFAEVVYQEDLAETRWAPEILLLPYRVHAWWWRISSIDRTGFIGAPTAPRKLLVPDGMGP
jgi:hypothetical protein